jgi:hypothetical protein
VALAEAAVEILKNPDSASDSALNTVSSVTMMAKWMANLEKAADEEMPTEAVESVKLLHGLLLAPALDDDVKNEMCVVCETWTRRELPEGDGVADNAVVYLLKRATSSKGTVGATELTHPMSH